MYKVLSDKKYNLIIGLVLLWGFAVNTVMCVYCSELFATWNQATVLIGYFVVALIGIGINTVSDNPVLSFIGYNLIVLPIGVVLSLSLEDYYASSIAQAFIMTTIITLLMIILASIKPTIFNSLGTVLFICLTGVVVIELVMIFAGIYTPKWWDWLVALLFCGYIGYDWSKAQRKRKTVDNAIDSAAELYLDIINLFIRLLGSSGNKKSK